MNIEIQAVNFTISQAINQYIQRRVKFGLKKRQDAIRRIIVRLTDINGPKGGKDKCCHIQIVMPKIEDVIIEDTEVNIYQAVDKAVERASRNVNKYLAKKALFKRTFKAPMWSKYQSAQTY